MAMYYVPIIDACAVSSSSNVGHHFEAVRWDPMLTDGEPAAFVARTESDRLTFNVSGTKFETYSQTLNRFPNSRLGDPERRKFYWNESRREYFIDRHRLVFQAILQCFQCGALRKPMEVPEDIFIAELRYYDLGQQLLDDYFHQEGIPIFVAPPLPTHPIQKMLWKLFELPQTSLAAKAVGMFSILMILVSVVVICLETLPYFALVRCSNVTYTDNTGNKRWHLRKIEYNIFFLTETICVSWFTIEFVIRFFSAPNKKKFCKDIMNIFDLGAVLPYFFILISEAISESDRGSCDSAGSFHLRVMRLIRVIRVLKLTKHAAVLRVVGKTLAASVNELALFVFFLIVSTVLFSSGVYYAENSTNPQFESIPAAFWWAVITLTTVGYGDIVPKTSWGKLIASFCVVLGLLGIAMPVPIIVTNFLKFYRLETGRQTKGI